LLKINANLFSTFGNKKSRKKIPASKKIKKTVICQM
jgi:hypothetical protein